MAMQMEEEGRKAMKRLAKLRAAKMAKRGSKMSKLANKWELADKYTPAIKGKAVTMKPKKKYQIPASPTR